MKACTDKDAHAVALWNRSLGTGGSRVISAKDLRLSNVVDRTGIVSRTVADGIVPVRRRLAFRELSIVDVGRLGNEVPFLRPADGAISIAMDRRARTARSCRRASMFTFRSAALASSTSRSRVCPCRRSCP